jgi:F-type H+-transporting ATPase subunit delta
MNEGKIAVRYAKALYTLAKEESLSDKIKQDLEYIRMIITESAEFKNLLENSAIKQSKKKELFELLFKDTVHVKTRHFLDLVLKNRRESYLTSIVRFYMAFYKKEKGIKPAILTTAVPLSEETKKSITGLITGKMNILIDLEEKTDEKIIGGFILKIDDQQIDASVSSRLGKIKKELLNR